MNKRIAAVLGMVVMLGMCGVARGTCQVEAVVPGSQQAVNQPNVLSGSAFIPNSQQVNGSGVGPWVTGNTYQIGPQFSFDYQNLSGDQTIVAQLTKGSATAPESTGILSWGPHGVSDSYVGLYFTFQNGWLATLEQSIVSQGGSYRTSTILAQQQVTGLFLKLVKTSGSGGFANFSAYYSNDGSNYALLGTANSVVLDGNMGFGLYASGGNATTVLTTTWQNISGLMLTSLTDIDVNTSVPGSSYAAGSASAGVQPGQLFIGPNPVSGEILVFNCGTGNTVAISNSVTFIDLTNNRNILFVANSNFTPQVPNCDSICTYSYLQVGNGTGGSVGPFNLVSGHQYEIQNQTQATIPSKGIGTALATQTLLLNP